MPIRDRIIWNRKCPFSDPRLQHLDTLVQDFKHGRLPSGWKGNKVWENRWNDLPARQYGHYREFYIGDAKISGSLRVVVGNLGEVYISGNHHRDWRQVVGIQ